MTWTWEISEAIMKTLMRDKMRIKWGVYVVYVSLPNDCPPWPYLSLAYNMIW